jgi:hypothetical protein
VEYLKKSPAPALIMVTTGLHDMHYVVAGSLDYWVENLIWYLSLLTNNFPQSRIVWLTISSINDALTPPEWRHISTSRSCLLMNQVFFEKVLPLFPNLQVVDLFESSNSPPGMKDHSDNVHMSGDYYRRLRNFVISLGCRAWNLC